MAVLLRAVSSKFLYSKNHFIQTRSFSKLNTLRASTVPDSQLRGDKKIKDNVEVAVIGGGCVGASIAYHLAKQGVKDVVLLEKSELTAGSTWHAAGLTTTFHPGINVKRLHWYSLSLYTQLERETKQEVGLHRPGSLRILTTPGRVEEAKYMISRAGWHDAYMWMLTPEEVCEQVPYMNMDNVLGGLFTPGDGHIDPYSLTQALAVGARNYGAEIYLSSPVTKISPHQDGQWNVHTPHGVITAKKIVNAAGFWGREIGKMVGADHPLIPIHHQYLVTTGIPEVKACQHEMPVVRDLEGSYYIRKERDGLLFGPYEKASKMKIQDEWWDKVTPGFGKELFESDIDRVMENVECVMERFPCVKEADIASTIAGPITYTPDILPMIGPFPEVPNYWCAIGFGYGVVHAGGAGKYLADWMQTGEPPFDLNELDPGRYGKWTNKEYVLSKCRESYGFNNLQAYPKEERYAGRPMRMSPFYEVMKDAGAQYTFSSGWEVPKWFAQEGDEAGYKPSYYRTNWFEPLRREVHNVLKNVSIADISAFAKIEVKGKDASKYMDYMVANKLPTVGATNVSHMLSPSGKVYAEVTVSTLAADHFLVITGGGSEYHDLRWMLEQSQGFDDVQIRNKTDELATLSISGPKSRDLLEQLCDEDVSSNSFKFMQNKQMNISGIPVLALRVSYTGELGWEFYVKNDRALELYNALVSADQKFSIGHIGSYAINSMRIEKGFRLWGAEMNMDVDPFQAGLDFFIKLNKKSNFIGRDALIKIKQTLPKRRLVCMLVDTDCVDAEGNESLWYAGKVVGNTTSGCYGYTVEKSIAYGYLPIYLTDPGTKVDVELMGSKYKATVVPEPLVLMEAARARKASK
ncbi:dimethylglycine dehydrogenase, mitochondrial-like [Hydractinia symbiolongicarpus]|uniref:dimethylglycine dehydrogenase, mitochondrial-like n=1 Tax=Hydractinia symbiolongicarpus TaxID=13093 RepID=UPI00254A5CE0|nr:dimethylglycine dehydrogenase, mitochondrial-like [Hydractinia symbiolongicarpus]